ncbi:condensin-2 complex subunit G2 [Pantherophis guttatus]|uniref:Condensin-2 complex subunit G2 n=1 Tax=Pantherophis guttatus TaxID=94885 RepID=A0A6P9AH17_PANGU|nr:condensin-2 complex subunit G2 [Pantherophis guttatus]XP_060539551.1 condensin-2 complex subunit G2 [Pantherophis guttatus]
MRKRDVFLKAVCKDSIEEFLHFIQLHNDASDPFDLHELVQELSRKQKETLWNRLKDLLAKVLLDNPIEEWQKVKDDSMETEKNATQNQSTAVIQGVATIVTASVPTLDENIDIKALLECAVILNGILSLLPDSEKSLLGAIQCLSECWWEKGLEGKEQFGKTAFLMLLKKSLGKKTVVGADVTRLCHLHPVLLCFDYDSEESNEIKDLLLQFFMSPGYFKKEEGRRFLSFLFTWNVNFIKLIHGTIKNQLLCFPRSLMNHVAEVYFRAWKKSSGEILEVIEYSCIQDFMHHAVHLPRKSPLHSKVREMLSYFHKQNKCRQGVEEVLYRLYQPILWRALKARNSEIRSNAALLFGDAFPILDPSFNKNDMEKEIQRQFDELFAILEDPQPIIRSTGILGVGKITSKYWEMIPAAVLAELLKTLIEHLAFDASSADVRCAVFKCLPIILDNILSHPLLEQLLPTLKYNLHDNSEKVRVAFVDMLLKIKATKAAKFWKICPVEHLLTRLEIDSQPVSRRLVNLLISSFLPINQPEVWCERCVTLIQMNASAARTFYQYAHKYTSPTNIAKLMLAIRNCLNSSIQQQLKESESGDENNEKENMTVTDNLLSVDDIPSMAGFLEIIVILWRSIQKPLDCNEEAKNHIVQKFASVLPVYLKVFTDDRCVSPIIILASFIPPTAIPTFSCGVISKLKNMENGVTEKKYSTLLDCLCRWGKIGHILELICDWITAEPRNRKTNKTQRRVQIQETDEPKPELALDYLEYLLTHCMNRNCLLSLPRKKLDQFLRVLECGKDALDSYIQGCNLEYCGLYQATAVRAFSLYCRFNIHLLHKFVSEEQDYLSALEKTGTWIENSIVPHFLLEEEEDYLKPSSEIPHLVIQTYLAVCKDLIAVGLGDFEFQASLLNLASKIIYRRKGSNFIPMLLSILREIVEAFLACDIVNTDCITELLNNVQKMFQKILESMAFMLRRQQEEGIQLIHSAREPLGEFVHAFLSCVLIFPAIYRGVISSLLAAVVVEINCSLKKKVSNAEELITPKTFLDLPPLSSVLMAIVNKSANGARFFLNELLEYIESEECEGIISLTTSVYIVVLIKGKQKPSYINAIAATLQKKITAYNEITKEGVERVLCEAALGILNEMLGP